MKYRIKHSTPNMIVTLRDRFKKRFGKIKVFKRNVKETIKELRAKRRDCSVGTIFYNHGYK